VPRFFYIARNNLGKKSTGYEEANSEEEVISRLQARNLIVVDIASEAKEGSPGFKQGILAKVKIKRRHFGVKFEDLVLFSRQLATLLGAGITILKALEVISQQVASHKLFSAIKSLQKHMEAGLSLHEAMARHPAVFSELWVNLIESGEASGNLAIILDRLASYLERNAAFRRKVISALIYPALLILVALGALLFMTIKIIPTFAELFQGFNVQLPLLTRVIIQFSMLIRKFFLIGIALTVAAGYFFKRYISTKEGQRAWESFKFKLPTFGEFFRVLVVERFSSQMATLVESGVPILFSLEITEHSVGSILVSDIIRSIKEDIRQGKPLSQPMDKCGFFDPMVVQMVTVGEEIGELSQMFKRINSYYQDYVDTFLNRFTSMFEPIALIFVGLAIGILVVGMFLPIFQIAQIGG